MPSLTIPAPAKLNLFLHIIGRREDGYHLLQTVFQFLDYSDTLTFSSRSDAIIQLNTPIPNVPAEQNLIVRAAKLLQNHTGINTGADISLEKRLPMGGGLGGGSSDAASTLLALNKLWNTQLSLPELAKLGLQLGADVPVFVEGFAAFAEGVGEKLQPVYPQEPWYLVITPPTHIETAKIFQHTRLTRGTSAIKVAAFETGGHTIPFKNDCESVVRSLSPEVDTALIWLSQFGDAKMTGTGACCFIACNSKEEAEQRLKQSPYAGFVAKGCNVSPAHLALKNN